MFAAASNRSPRKLLGLHLSMVVVCAGVLMAMLTANTTPKAHAQRIPTRPDLITPQAEAAIKKGQAFLVRTQSRDGSWRAGGAYDSYPTAMTSLAGIALMAGGNTPVEGPYAKNVRRAVDYIISCSNPNGLIARMNEEQRPMFGHGYAMLFLAQAYGMEQDATRQARIKRVLTKAVQLTSKSQSQYGGWLYTPDSGGDEGAVTITQVQGLRAVRNAGIKVPKKTIDNAILYIEKSANDDGGIRYTARGGGSSRAPITAAAVAVLYNAGDYDNPVANRCLAFLKKLTKGNRYSRAFAGHRYYGMLYMSQAMYLSSEENWQAYFPVIREELIRTQAANGSWMGDSVGTTYGTSIALVTLQLPYRYLPIYQR